MTHVHVCRLCKLCQCVVCLTCLAGKMSSQTILIGLSIFRCGVEKSVHGRPSCPYDCSLQNTTDFTAWCKLVSRECKFNDRAGECGVVRYTMQFFVLDKAKALPIRIGSQTAWVVIYRFCCVVFGLNTSPFLLNATLRPHYQVCRS